MRFTLILLITFAMLDCAEWSDKRAPSKSRMDSISEISTWYEVSHSKMDVAVGNLKGADFVELNKEQGKYYTGSYFTMASETKVYLVRSIMGHGGTGRYVVRFKAGDLEIVHGSLGHSDRSECTAMVVVTNQELKNVYYWHSIAE